MDIFDKVLRRGNEGALRGFKKKKTKASQFKNTEWKKGSSFFSKGTATHMKENLEKEGYVAKVVRDGTVWVIMFREKI